MVGRSTGRDQAAVRWLYRLTGVGILGRFAWTSPQLTPLLFFAALVLLGFDRFVLDLVRIWRNGGTDEVPGQPERTDPAGERRGEEGREESGPVVGDRRSRLRRLPRRVLVAGGAA